MVNNDLTETLLDLLLHVLLMGREPVGDHVDAGWPPRSYIFLPPVHPHLIN